MRGTARWRALTGHFTTTLRVRNETKWVARLVLRAPDAQPAGFRPTVEIAPSGEDEDAVVEIPLRRTGVGKRRAQVRSRRAARARHAVMHVSPLE